MSFHAVFSFLYACMLSLSLGRGAASRRHSRREATPTRNRRAVLPPKKCCGSRQSVSLPCVKELTHMRSMCVGVAETGSELARKSPLGRLPCVKGAGAKRLRDWQIFALFPLGKRGVLLRDQKYQKSAKEGFSSSFANLRALARVRRRKYARVLCAATGDKKLPQNEKASFF